LLPIVIWLAILGKSTAATYPHVEHMVNRVSLSRQSENGTENDRELAKTTEHSLHDVSDRVIELRGIIEKGKSEKDSTDRDLYQYLSDFQEQEKKFNDQFQELICTLNESQLSDIIDEMNKLQDQAQMAWDLKQKQLTDLDEILHHENYTDTALANNEDDAKKEDDVQKECASLAAYLGKANETAQAELMELDKHEEEVTKLQNKLEDCVCPCVWGVWSDWSECTKTCKAGSQSRKRIVAKIPRNGGGCKGGSVETITCNTEVCCPVDCVWGIWEPWPDCPSGCPLEGGQHEKIRTRDRKVEASCNGELCRGKDYEKQPCSREEEVLDMLGTCLSGKVHLAKEKNEMTEDLKKCKDSASTAKAKDHSGNIMVVSESSVTVVDLARNQDCRYEATIDDTYGGITTGGSGGAVTSSGEPIICADGFDQCYKWSGGTWSVIYTIDFTQLPNANTLASVAIDDWIFFAGGAGFSVLYNPGEQIIGHILKETDHTFLLKDDGTVLKDSSASPAGPPNLSTAKSAACAALVVSEGTRRVIAVLGGLKKANFKEVAKGDMELFDCDMSETNPTCTKLSNGPSLLTARGNFGCGVITAEDGSRILFAMRQSEHMATTEVLDVSSTTVGNWGSWQKVSYDVSDTDVVYGHQSFLPLKDDTKGLWFLANKNYYYEVTCASISQCTFTKRQLSLTGAYTLPLGATPLLVHEEDFNCA